MNQQKINNVFALSSKDRYGYLIRKVADFETIYLIADDEGNYVMVGSEGANVLPVWPEREFAELFLTDDWTGYQVEENSIYDFINWLNELEKDNIDIAGFPNIELNTVHVTAKDMKDHLDHEISQYE